MEIQSSILARKIPCTEEPGHKEESDTTERISMHARIQSESASAPVYSLFPSFCMVRAALLFLIFIDIKSSCYDMRMSLVVQMCGYSVTHKHSNKNRNVAAQSPSSPPPPSHSSHPLGPQGLGFRRSDFFFFLQGKKGVGEGLPVRSVVLHFPNCICIFPYHRYTFYFSATCFQKMK